MTVEERGGMKYEFYEIHFTKQLFLKVYSATSIFMDFLQQPTGTEIIGGIEIARRNLYCID